MDTARDPFTGLSVTPNPIRKLRLELLAHCSPKHITPIDLTQANPTGPTSADYAKEMGLLVAAEGRGESPSNAYTDSRGYPTFLTALADLEAQVNGLNIPSSHILATPGAGEAVATALWGLKLVKEGGEVLILAPFFPSYLEYVKAAGLTPKRIHFSSEGEQLTQLEDVLGDQTRAIILNSPNNPCGQMYSAQFLQNLGEMLNRKPHVLAISDEPYRQLRLPDIPWVSVVKELNYANTGVAYSFSKEGRLAGVRIGYLALHPDFPNGEQVRDALATSLVDRGIVQASTREQMALSKCALPLGVDWSSTMQLIKSYANQLQGLGYEIIQPQGGLCLCVKSPDGDGTKLFKNLFDQGVGSVPGVSFGILAYVRLALCGEDAKSIDETIARFGKVKELMG
ncbi:MAG: aminotransferase class I/II-fold pyridoxal phosphate-dependent enzyme [Nanoarchaeota archaeon]